MSKIYKLNAEYARRLYFINIESLKEEMNEYTSNGCAKKTKKVTYYMNKLKCSFCGRIFHKEFGLESHSIEMHGQEIKPKSQNGTVRSRQYQKDVWEGEMSDGETTDEDIIIYQDESDIEEVSVVTTNRKEKVLTRKRKSVVSSKIVSFDESTAYGLSLLDEFQPKLVIMDIYINPGQETSMALPDKEEAMEFYAKKSMLKDSYSSFDSGIDITISDSEDSNTRKTDLLIPNKKRFLTSIHSNLKRKSRDLAKTCPLTVKKSKTNSKQSSKVTSSIIDQDIAIIDDELNDINNDLSQAPVEIELFEEVPPSSTKITNLKRKSKNENIENPSHKITRLTINSDSDVEEVNGDSAVETTSNPAANLTKVTSDVDDCEVVIDDSDEENEQSLSSGLAKLSKLKDIEFTANMCSDESFTVGRHMTSTPTEKATKRKFLSGTAKSKPPSVVHEMIAVDDDDGIEILSDDNDKQISESAVCQDQILTSIDSNIAALLKEADRLTKLRTQRLDSLGLVKNTRDVIGSRKQVPEISSTSAFSLSKIPISVQNPKNSDQFIVCIE